MNPEVSIITPAYNSEKYISETIDSVLKQTFQNWEMIIVDDGSVDSTDKIVKTYTLNDQRICYYKLGCNSGRPAVPRNYAIEKSCGNYLAFLDSDDLWLPEKLEYQLELMKQNNLEFSYGPTKSDTGGEDISFSFISSRRRRDLVRGESIACLTVMIRNRRMYRPIFDEEPFLKAAEDSYAWMQMCKKTNRIGYYQRGLSIYRVKKSDSIINEYHSDPFARMAKQYLYYSKLYLTEAITKKEAINSYWRIFHTNFTFWIRLSFISRLKRYLKKIRKKSKSL